MLIANILRIKNGIINNWVVIEIIKYKFSVVIIYLSLVKVDVTEPGIGQKVFRDLELNI